MEKRFFEENNNELSGTTKEESSANGIVTERQESISSTSEISRKWSTKSVNQQSIEFQQSSNVPSPLLEKDVSVVPMSDVFGGRVPKLEISPQGATIAAGSKNEDFAEQGNEANEKLCQDTSLFASQSSIAAQGSKNLLCDIGTWDPFGPSQSSEKLDSCATNTQQSDKESFEFLKEVESNANGKQTPSLQGKQEWNAFEDQPSFVNDGNKDNSKNSDMSTGGEWASFGPITAGEVPSAEQTRRDDKTSPTKVLESASGTQVIENMDKSTDWTTNQEQVNPILNSRASASSSTSLSSMTTGQSRQEVPLVSFWRIT